MTTSCILLGALSAAHSLPLAPKPWMDVQATPEARAAALLSNLTLAEKLHFFHGSGSGYVGNVEAQRGGAIPALTLNDGPQGFRGISGTSTAWPSALGLSATWSVATAKQWGAGMGDEFFRKGANVQLGPGMCVARVPRNGRNFEYLSGEDPALGAAMVPPVVQGIQGQHVIANAKHYVNNNQETKRNSVSENVDERTQFEIYYPPFEAAAAAGVGSIMCSYNKIRGTWSCENPETLQRDLKERLGFKGWVMSDWGATHSTSMNAGLDQEMPGAGHMGDALAKLVAAGNVTAARVDDGVTRVLVPMFAMGLFDEPWLSNKGNLKTNVTSAAHNELARDIAAEGVVLLKNEGGVLPITATKDFKIAFIGKEATNPTVHGGGSGQVVPYYTSAPLDAMRARLGIDVIRPNNCSDGHFEQGIDYLNQDSQTRAGANSVEECCALCAAREGCNYFTYQASKICWMKSDNAGRVASDGRISGACHAQPAPGADCNKDGVCVSYDAGSDTGSAAAAAAAADLAVVFVATNSHEGTDRSSLSFDGNADALAAAVAAANSNTVVVGVTPGAALTPWRDAVAAALVAFMPGQEWGNAITDVLLGTVNPSGHLPLTLPTKENECPVFTQDMWPGSDNAAQANYSEHMLIGYRCYDHFKVTPAYPFGHGLSYTTFGITLVRTDAQHVDFHVQNTGAVDGAAVVQLYLGFPAAAGEPPQQLKHFQKFVLKAGATASGSFALTDRDTSVWDAGAHAWRQVSGEFSVSVGLSSRDPKAATGSFTQ
jgi:beta-glucosidase